MKEPLQRHGHKKVAFNTSMLVWGMHTQNACFNNVKCAVIRDKSACRDLGSVGSYFNRTIWSRGANNEKNNISEQRERCPPGHALFSSGGVFQENGRPWVVN